MIDVSLLICTRNRRDSLSATLASIARAAGSTRLEVIVVDNGSTDDSAAMVRHWAAEQAFAVRLLVESRVGLARARNVAMAAARGRIIAMTDDDCVLHADYFGRLADAFARHPGPVIIGGRILLGDPSDLPVTVKLEDHPMIAGRDAFPGGFVMGANLAFTADIREKVGAFDERFGAGAPFRAAEDTDFLFRALGRDIPVLYDPGFVVDHHHGRKAAHEVVALLAGYGYGDGALYAKHLWRDARIARTIRDDLRNLATRFAGPVPQIRHFHAFRLRHILAGFARYGREAIRSRRSGATPSSAA